LLLSLAARTGTGDEKDLKKGVPMYFTA